jgi:hypothetical protein
MVGDIPTTGAKGNEGCAVICPVTHPLLSPVPLASTPPVIDELLGQLFGGYCLPFP